MNDAETIYTDLWSKSFPLFQRNQYDIDPLILDPDDSRRGLTLRAGLAPEIILNVEEFTQKARAFAPDQYFTPSSDLHLTVLTIVSCQRGFNHDLDKVKSYVETISACIRDIPPPRIKFTGITASSSCILLQGYPENDSLKKFRNLLRAAFKSSGLPHAIDFRYSIKTAHVTIMRFVKQQDSIRDFAQFIAKNRHYKFGAQQIEEVELVCNDWCHKINNTKSIETFSFRIRSNPMA